MLSSYQFFYLQRYHDSGSVFGASSTVKFLLLIVFLKLSAIFFLLLQVHSEAKTFIKVISRP